MLRSVEVTNNLDGLGFPITSLSWVENGDFVNGLPESYYLVNNSGSAPTVPSADGFVVVSSGTNAAAHVAFAGDTFAHYNSGQAIIGVGSSMWEAGVANNTRKVGMFNPACEYGIELSGTTWRVFHRSGAVQEMQTLIITTAASVAGNVTITLDGVAFTPAVTNSGVINTTAREIAAGTYTGWDVFATGATVTFIANWSGVRGGSYSFSGGATGAAAAAGILRIRQGATYTLDNAINLSSVNGDKLNGGGPSRITIGDSKLIVIRCMHGYLGAANPSIDILAKGDNQWVNVHTFEHSGTASVVNLNPPSMYFGWQNINTGNTTSVAIRGASHAAAVSNLGDAGRGRVMSNTSLRTLSTGSSLPLFAVRVGAMKNGRVNWDEFQLTEISAYATALTRTVFLVVRNPTTYDGAVWVAASSGAMEYDQSATAYSGGEVVGEGYVNAAGQVTLTIGSNVIIQRGDIVLVASNGTGGATYTADATIAGIER